MAAENSREIIRLNAALTHLSRRLQRIDDAQGIGRARLSALAALHFGGTTTLTKLANTEMVTGATMHHVIRGLEADELVTRRQDSRDKRSFRIELTEKGRDTIVAAHTARIHYLESLQGNLSLDQLQYAVNVLEALNSAARLKGR